MSVEEHIRGYELLPRRLLHVSLPGGLEIRLADPSEYEATADMLCRAFVTSSFVSDLYRHRLLSIPQRSSEEDIWVISDEQGHLYGGYTTIDPIHVADECFAFNTLGVSREVWGRHLGQALVSHAISLATEYGYRRILIHSGPNMVYAHRLYYHCGFKRRPEFETLVVDGGQHLRVFTYDIPNPDNREDRARIENVRSRIQRLRSYNGSQLQTNDQLRS